MSRKPTPITSELQEYIDQLLPGNDQLLTELLVQAAAQGIPAISISESQGNFLQFLLKSIGAQRVLELGTLGGYSAIVMARALQASSQLVTIESQIERVSFAQEYVEKAGLSDIVTVIHADARNYLEHTQPSQQWDFVFIDADKANYHRYIELVYPHVRKGGIICIDNAFAMGQVAHATETSRSWVRATHEANKLLCQDSRFFSSIIPLGDGLVVAYKQ